MQNDSTRPTPPQPRQSAVDATQRQPRTTRPGKPPKRRNWVFRLLLPFLAAIVFVNVCVTMGFGMFYVQARSVAVAQDETPPSPMEAIATLLPGAPPTQTPIPEPTTNPLPPVPSGVVYFLALGLDARPDQWAAGEPTRSDTMMIARVDFEHNTVRLLSFPRDLWLAMPPSITAYGPTVGRINQGYYYGELYNIPGGGPQGAMDTVTLNFGIPLQGYAMVNFQGLVQGVDALGGITVNVPESIYDPNFPTEDYGTMVLSIPAGPNHFDGITALRYARTRHQDSDVNRTRRQQLVVLGIVDAALQVNALARLPDLWQALDGNYDTSLSMPEALAYGLAMQQINTSEIETFAFVPNMLIPWTTPGGAHVWIPRNERIAPMISAFMAD